MNRYPLIQRAPGLLPWYDSLAGFQREVHRLFQDLAETGYGPGLDLYEEEEAFVLQCELPGPPWMNRIGGFPPRAPLTRT